MNEDFASLSPCAVADVVELACVMRREVRPLYAEVPRVAGPAFTVKAGRHDNLMLHAALYLAQPGDVIVVEAGDDETAVAGGNVCALMQRRGVAGLVVDGVVRDVAETRAARFPVFARGVSPIPGKRLGLDGTGVGSVIRCGGVDVSPGDVVVADEEGIVVVPRARAADVFAKAKAKAAADAALSLEEWGARHRANVETALAKRGLDLAKLAAQLARSTS